MVTSCSVYIMCVDLMVSCSSLKTPENLEAIKAIPPDRVLIETGISWLFIFIWWLGIKLDIDIENFK